MFLIWPIGVGQSWGIVPFITLSMGMSFPQRSSQNSLGGSVGMESCSIYVFIQLYVAGDVFGTILCFLFFRGLVFSVWIVTFDHWGYRAGFNQVLLTYHLVEWWNLIPRVFKSASFTFSFHQLLFYFFLPSCIDIPWYTILSLTTHCNPRINSYLLFKPIVTWKNKSYLQTL